MVSVTGPNQELRSFHEWLGSKATVKYAAVIAWYHGGDQLKGMADEVLHDIDKRQIQFPNPCALRQPLRSSYDGSFAKKEELGKNGLACWVISHMLIYPFDWLKTSEAIVSMLTPIVASQEDFRPQFSSFGPSSDWLLGGFKSRGIYPRFDMLEMLAFQASKTLNTLANRKDDIAIGVFIDDMWKFDNAFFNITPREAKSMDPQQRILLRTAQAALDNAGYVRDFTPTFQRATMGCYIGLATGDYTDNLRDNIDVYYSPGTLRAFHSGRISFVHNLSGPSIVTDTACSSSLVSVYQACRALNNGDCTAAIAGGVNTISSPDVRIRSIR